ASVLESSFKQLNPEKVLCFPPAEDILINISNYDYWTNSSERIVLDICRSRNCEIIYPERNNINREDIKNLWNRKMSLARHSRLAMIRSLKLANIFKENFRHMFRGNPDLSVIAISQMKDGLFDFKDAAKIWERQGGKIIKLALIKHLYNISPHRAAGTERLIGLGMNQQAIKSFWGSLCKREELRSWFRFGGIDCFPAAQNPLRNFITKTMPEFIAYTAYLEDLFLRKRVGLLICTAVADPVDIAEVIAARRSSAVVISSEHGGIGSLRLPIVEYQDYRPADFSLRYGRESVRLYNDEFKIDKRSNSCVLSAVGSVPLAKMFKRERSKDMNTPKKQKTLLYIPTGLVGEQMYFAWNHYPDLWYWRLLKDVFLLFKTYPDIKVLFKEYPFDNSRNPIKDYVKARNITNVSFIPAQSPTEDHLGKADLLVMDFPSTSLMGALCTRKPIILFYDPRWLKLADRGSVLLEKRVELATSKEKLLSTLKRWCDMSYWPEIYSPDDSYLKAFGIIDERHNPAQEQIRKIKLLLKSR
ncbi:MAG: hypothetical protein PHC37_06765, partial [Candidatus Omnitrophica bacterium]|nr:hypothetical protein [Candidatus Omnitrophota bacterium]